MTAALRLFSVLLMASVARMAGAADMLTLGFHAHHSNHVEQAARIGYTAIRLWDTGTDWAKIKPQREQWDFERIDAYLAASEKAHLKVLWTLGGTPRWASVRPNEKCAYGLGCAAEPDNIEDWRRYVRAIATTFRGRIECYEPWNEISFPNDPTFRRVGDGGAPGQFFSGSVEAMVNLARVAYEEIKQADPEACVLSPSFHNSGHWAEKFDKFLAAGGGRYFDAVSQHFYFSDEPEQVMPTIHAMRQVMEKHGLAHIPMWNTEVGVPFLMKQGTWSALSLADSVYAQTLRTYLLNASAGISRVYWYAWDNKIFGFVNPGTNTDFGSAAASAAVHLLDGSKSINCREQGNFWQCRVIAGNRKFKVMWFVGKNAKAFQLTLERNATRWGAEPEFIDAGKQIALDGRPVIVDD